MADRPDDVGLRSDDRVASLMPNGTALIIHYIACMKAGLIGVPLNYRYTAPEIEHALGVSEASILLVHVEREPDLAGPPSSRAAVRLYLADALWSAAASLASEPVPQTKNVRVPSDAVLAN